MDESEYRRRMAVIQADLARALRDTDVPRKRLMDMLDAAKDHIRAHMQGDFAADVLYALINLRSNVYDNAALLRLYAALNAVNMLQPVRGATLDLLEYLKNLSDELYESKHTLDMTPKYWINQWFGRKLPYRPFMY